MPIEMPKGLPFSVDTWSPSSDGKRHHFLTHAHKDHSSGITAHASYPIYSTHVTKSLVLQQYPQLDASLFVEIEIGGKVVIEDPDGTFSVSAFDANHCPGAIMFLFEGNFGNILHTGDCRLTTECLQNLPEKYVGKKGREPKCRLDYLFLDCTFGNTFIKIPSKYSAIRQVINCIWKHPNALVVYLTCDLLAQDELLVEVSRTFGSKVYVDRINNAECFQALTITAPEVLTENESSRFQIFEGFYKFYERARAKLEAARFNFQPEPLFIRPSAQWYVFEEDPETGSRRKEMPTGAKKDSFGIWHICYSSHSSREELEWALQVLQPKKVVSTTPGCWAMELNYVKKHCLNSQVSSDDPLWKLMDISFEAGSSSPPASILPEVTVPCVVSPLKMNGSQPVIGEANQLISTNLSTRTRTELHLNLSPPSTRPPITLFGRARLACGDSSVLQGQLLPPIKIDSACQYPKTSKKRNSDLQICSSPGNPNCCEENSPHRYPNRSEEQDPVLQIGAPHPQNIEEEESVLKEGGETEARCKISVEKKLQTVKNTSPSSVGSSKSFNESLRKLYRSMNVSVPRPLPSLVELLESTKRAKRRVRF
ncbi:hypothetical protein IFM89_001655 [Coptis chinensis]|uniref:DNA repair metallo-beta-lactamase domain-containing protein n=1 Tax=Coptis chinensis TaxID=261450 RepID=A0A835LQC8_9MAGN|nr:hypothetical protein IFM89_001655 [Coptis chinensis]